MAEDPDKLVAQAFDDKQHLALARAVERLSSDEAMFFLEKLERALLKRKIQLIGYLVAMGMALVGALAALLIYGAAAEGTFMAWIFLLPIALIGATLWIFGRWADKVERGDRKLAADSETEQARAAIIERGQATAAAKRGRREPEDAGAGDGGGPTGER